jgi:hypothetical protein
MDAPHSVSGQLPEDGRREDGRRSSVGSQNSQTAKEYNTRSISPPHIRKL